MESPTYKALHVFEYPTVVVVDGRGTIRWMQAVQLKETLAYLTHEQHATTLPGGDKGAGTGGSHE